MTDQERRERHLDHIDEVMMNFASELAKAGINVYVPTYNPCTNVNYLIVSDGTGVIYVDYQDRLGLRLTLPVINKQNGELTTTMIGKYREDLGMYWQTPAEINEIKSLLQKFKEDGRQGLLAEVPFFRPNRHKMFQDYKEYYLTQSTKQEMVPYGEYLSRRSDLASGRL